MQTPEQFMEYFRTNYPGPNTIIARPDWHAPKIYRAAIAASAHEELLEACKEATSALAHWHGTLGYPITDAECAAVTELERIIANARAAIAKAQPSYVSQYTTERTI